MSKNMNIDAELNNFIEKNEGQVTLTDIAKHFYQYAVDKFCDLLENNMFEKCEFGEYGDITETYACSDNCDYVSEFVEQMRKAMEE